MVVYKLSVWLQLLVSVGAHDGGHCQIGLQRRLQFPQAASKLTVRARAEGWLSIAQASSPDLNCTRLVSGPFKHCNRVLVHAHTF